MDAKHLPQTPGIYQIKHTVSGKTYIGSSCSLRQRVVRHRYMLNKNVHHSPKLQSAWNKYGSSEFTTQVIESVQDKSFLLEREQYWIDHFDSYLNGFNCTKETGGGFTPSAETLKKMSDSHKGQKSWSKGKKLSAEHIRKLSLSHKGYLMPEDQKKKISESMKGRKSNPESIAKSVATKRANGYIRTNSHLIEYKGEIMTLSTASRKSGMAHSTLVTRLRKGWAVDLAMESPVREKRI